MTAAHEPPIGSPSPRTPLGRLWWRYSGAVYRLVALLVAGMAFLIAAFAPFIADDKPFRLEGEDGVTWPLLRALSAADVIWACCGIAPFVALLVAKALALAGVRVGAAVKASMVLVPLLGVVVAWNRPAINDNRPYAQEAVFRRQLANLDEAVSTRAVGVQSMSGVLGFLGRQAGGAVEFEAELDARHEVIEAGGDPLPGLGALAERNRRRLTALEAAPFPMHRRNPTRTDPGLRKLLPGSEPAHPLGTDEFGRDVLATLVHGSRAALEIAVLAVVLSTLIGLLLGGIAGYFGGRTDWWISRWIELWLCLPGLVIVLLLGAYLRPGPWTLALVFGSLMWTHPARLVRAEVRRVRALDFVTAGVALGGSSASVIWRHVLPHAVSPLFVSTGLGIGMVILTESTLTFLGLGDITQPSWGALLREARADIVGLWHLAVFPGLAIFVVILAFNIVAEGLREALDIRSG